MYNRMQAEQEVLGSILINPRYAPFILNRLYLSDFHGKRNRAIFRAITALSGQSVEANPAAVLGELRKFGITEETLSGDDLRRLMDITPTAAGVEESIQQLERERRVAL